MQALSAHNYLSFDAEHIWHPFTQAKLADTPLLVTKAEKEFIYVKDSNGEEKKIIDGISSWWVNIHGHCNKYIATKISEQLTRHEQVIFAGFTHEVAIEMVSKLLPLLPRADLTSELRSPNHRPRILDKVFFSDNGSTSVEVAIKMAIQYFYNNSKPQRKRLIALKDSYHGDTVGAMSSSNSSVFQEAFKALLFPVDFVDSPSFDNRLKPNSSLSDSQQKLILEEAKEDAENRSLQQIIELFNRYQDEIAAVIVEPLVQGAGGMKFYRPQFLQKLRKLCSDFEVLIIADEVFTGFGRTGDDFACKVATIVPDIICVSKGITGGFLPLGLTITTEEIYSAFYSDSKLKTFFHGHSYTGNSLACAAASASLDLYVQESRLEDVRYLNMRMKKELLIPELKNNPLVKDIRILGAIAVIELHSDQDYLSDLGQILSREFLKRNILLRPLGNVLYFLPPYTISVESLDYCLDTIKLVIKQLLEKN
jgi:adenosylmethionine---8-amino-7-oxononanoate aminotransferase